MENYETIPTKIIRPTLKGVKEFSCAYCGIAYSKKHYSILFKSKKLIYFEILYKASGKNKKSDKVKRGGAICHDCLFNFCRNLIFDLDLEGVVIYVSTGGGKKDYTMTLNRKDLK